MIKKWIFFFYYYLGWFACIKMAQSGYELLTLLIPIPLFLWSFFFGESIKAIFFSLLLSLVGMTFDSLASYREWIHFENTNSSQLLPLWLMTLWLLFAGTLPALGRFFKGKYFWAAALAAIFGPLTYKSGENFKLINFSQTTSLGFLQISDVVILYSVFWAIYFPVSLLILNKGASCANSK